MKNNFKKTTLGLLTMGIILSFGSIQASAFGGGQGGGQGQGLGRYVTAEERVKLQSISDSERQAYAQELREKYGLSNGQTQVRGQGKDQGIGRSQGEGNGQGQGNAHQFGHNEDPSALVDNIPASDVSDTEKEILINQYGEERMARDLYAYAAKKYPNVNTFSNITKSEQKHMDAIKILLDRYNIEAPTDYAKDNNLYVILKNKIDKSEKDAIEVGINVEIVDIDNIIGDIKDTDNDDFKIIFTNIGGASYNHLRAFVKSLENNGYTTDLKWIKYISQNEVNTKGGALKVKLAENLEKQGVKLPKQATSLYIQSKCNTKNSFVKKLDENKLNKYKYIIRLKYQKKINSISNNKLNLIIKKVDVLLSKIQNSTKYSQSIKEKYRYILIALKEVILNKLNME